MKTDIVFENLKVGQKLYSLRWGEVKVIKLLQGESQYPIHVKVFDVDGVESTDTLTKDGKYSKYHNLPTLFLTNPFEKLNQERVIEVQSASGNYIQRVCIKVVDGRALCYCEAKTLEEAKKATSTQVIGVGEWRELQPEQPEPEQPKEITIDGVEYVLTPKTK